MGSKPPYSNDDDKLAILGRSGASSSRDEKQQTKTLLPLKIPEGKVSLLRFVCSGEQEKKCPHHFVNQSIGLVGRKKARDRRTDERPPSE